MRHEVEDIKIKLIKWSIFTIVSLVMGNLFKINFFIILGLLSLGWCLILFVAFIYLLIRHFYD